MKQFGQLLVAAVLGSAVTISANHYFSKDDDGIRIVEHVSSVPTNTVAYTKNENGAVAPLDFTSVISSPN